MDKKQLIIIGFNKKVLSRVTFNAVEYELMMKLKKYFELESSEQKNFDYINRISSLYKNTVLKKVYKSLTQQY